MQSSVGTLPPGSWLPIVWGLGPEQSQHVLLPGADHQQWQALPSLGAHWRNERGRLSFPLATLEPSPTGPRRRVWQPPRLTIWGLGMGFDVGEGYGACRLTTLREPPGQSVLPSPLTTARCLLAVERSGRGPGDSLRPPGPLGPWPRNSSPWGPGRRGESRRAAFPFCF